MGAANGFVSTSPDSQYGAATNTLQKNYVLAQAFVMPNSGAQTIAEIGAYLAYVNYTMYVHFALFTDDSANSCPDSIVANSDTGAISVDSTSLGKISYSYSTKPSLTGGATYWITMGVGDQGGAGQVKWSEINDGTKNGLYKSSVTYPNWPATADAWHTHTNYADDLSFYAVYDSASGLSIPVVQATYRRRRM